MKKYKIGYTSGVFDLFHIGHLNILLRAKEHCDYLIVAVSTDALVKEYKNKIPVICQEDRAKIVSHIDVVDRVVFQTSLDKKIAKIEYNADAIFHGDDWKGSDLYNKIEEEMKELGVDMVYLPHTEGISSTLIKQKLEKK